MIVKGFRELKIWKLGKEIAVDIYQLTRSYPKEEMFGLTSQMRRASVSIGSNISEGFNRRSPKEFRHFLHIAYGSCAELETQIEISAELGYLGREKSRSALQKLDVEERMLKTLIDSLTRNSEPGTGNAVQS